EIGITLLIVFVFASLLGLLGVFMGSNLSGFWATFQDIIVPLGNWVYWLAIIGPLGVIVTLWWDLDYFFKVRKLKELSDTSSKAKFIKNLDEIEYLAWRLPKRYRMMVAEKKNELKISK
ncbi:MAG: DUF3198 domain-containing protein, partial [Thermoplasmata archaeon]